MKTNRYFEQARRMLRGAGTALVSVALVGALALGGCSGGSTAASTANADSSSSSGVTKTMQNTASEDWYDPEATTIDISEMDFEYGNRESSGDWDADGATAISLGESIEVDGDGAKADGSVVTITAAGTYVLSGEASDAQVVVNAGDDDKVQLVLNGASITCANGPALFVKNADKVYVTLAEGTSNTLADTAGNTATYGDGDDAELLNAAVYAKEDLCFNGSGQLTVSGNTAHAIKGKDDVVIAGGTYDISAVKDGIRGKDSVRVTNATMSIDAGSDGIQSSSSKDGKGYVSIDEGTVLDITAGDDGIQASRYLRITGGEVNVTAADDALHSDIDGLISGGTVTLAAGDDAFHTEFNLGVSGGTVDIQKCYEGLEGQLIVVADGDVNIIASDDGINAAQGQLEEASGEDSENAEASAGTASSETAQEQDTDAADDGGATAEEAGTFNDDSAFGGVEPPADGQAPEGNRAPADAQAAEGEQPADDDAAAPGNEAAAGQEQRQRPDGDFGGKGGKGGFGGGMMGDDGVSLLVIEGGTITVEAGGDGLDSNGDILMTGGTVHVYGPTSNGDGSLDTGGDATIKGGSFLAAGSSGMAEDFGGDSTQPTVYAQASGNAGDTVSIVDADGNELLSATVTKEFSCVVASAEGMEAGSTYKVLVNGEEAASVEAATESQATGMGGSFGDRGDRMGGGRGQDGMGPNMGDMPGRAGGHGPKGAQQEA